ncbi:probable transcriptional regulator, MerR family protein [unidentified eubacterium SCB49]|nr:probable transcriptional regulator, MerR family protein [unidentified eubacterium SCB49]
MVKTEFSIKDLENLSGVKAHTIRIWEKRYNLLSPDRSDTNIRKYNIEGLKKLLNVTQLYNQGHKISKIASLSDPEIFNLTKEHNTSSQDIYAINQFKTAMLSFNYELFNNTFNELEQTYSFSETFGKIFIPLLIDIGILWQTGTIDPVHERYISELIRQKLTLKITQSLSTFKKKNDLTIALFLPLNEIHEISLLFVQYLLINAGFHTLYLGSNIPLENLSHITNHHDNIFFITYLTTEPSSVEEYLEDFDKKMCKEQPINLWCLGPKSTEINTKNIKPNIKVITDIEEFNNQIKQLTNA